MKIKSLIALVLSLVLCLSSIPALACTAIYVGGGLTETGDSFFARSEDYANSYAKLFYVSPAGNHKAGDAYTGCYGFNYVFEKDSYSYTAFRDDNGEAQENVCPNCGGNHIHTPYEAGGTNEMGVSMSATETLYSSNAALKELDPYVKNGGIEEAEITTVILSQAASAKEGVELLLKIYDTYGCYDGAGIFIGDDKEIWYIENLSGTQYVAVKLNDNVAFAVPNQSVIGLIDLDDTENVIASDKLIEIAKQAGTYVGSEEANTIDYMASYECGNGASSRMISAMQYMNGVEKEDFTVADYVISNVGQDGAIVPFYSNVKLTKAYTIADMIGYFQIPGIGKGGNTEIHIFQIGKTDSQKDTVEWVGMNNGCYTPFIPYYPMLTKDTYSAYQKSMPSVGFVQETPESGIFYPGKGYAPAEDGKWARVDGYKVLPENWQDSFYWTCNALSNVMDYGEKTEDEIAAVKAAIAQIQQDCYAAYDQLKEAVDADAATKVSMDAAQKAHEDLIALVNSVK